MSPTTTSIIAAAGVVLGIISIVRAVRRPTPTLRAVKQRLEPTLTSSSSASRNPAEALRARIADEIAASALGRRLLDSAGRAMRITGVTLPDLVGQIVTFAAVGFVSASIGVGSLISLGVLPTSVFVLPLIPLLTLLIAWQPVATVRSQASKLQRELRRVTNDFVQMVAVGLTTNRSIEEAVAYAAEIGDSEGFGILQRTIASAQPMGVPVWESLASMASTYELDELRGLANSMQRQAGIGVNVAGTIRAEAKALRAKQLNELTDTADKANANLSTPTMGMVMGVVVFIGYPIIQQVLGAFS